MRKDQAYITGLCDALLGCTALREHRFDFLRGDPGLSGRTMMLPVDAYYPSLQLVIEYCERQHTEAVQFFDGRMTVSGMSRGEQRKRYDERKLAVLPAHGIHVLQLHYHRFACDRRKRLKREPTNDTAILRQLLAPYITDHSKNNCHD